MAHRTAADFAHRLLLSVQSWCDSIGIGGNVDYDGKAGEIFAEAARTLDWKTLFDPPLPPGLATIPPISRLLALVLALPLLAIGLLDFAGYAVFRTLGLRKRRVRVNAGRGMGRSGSQKIKIGAYSSATSAPLLSPGTYDAETLLRHRARSTSDAKREAEELWERTGGSFARVPSQHTDGDAWQGSARTANGEDLGDDDDEEEDSFGMVSGIGFDGPLGFTDTDAESDAGDSSGSHSARSSRRKGKGAFGGLQFTPMSEDPPHLGGSGGGDGRGHNASWLDRDGAGGDGKLYTPSAAAAADLEP